MIGKNMHFDADAKIRLNDGRELAYTLRGKLNGTPIFIFHGTPGSRYFTFLDTDTLNRLNILLISVDRPGYGNSTPALNRKLTDFAFDIEQLMDNLKLEKAYFIGYSGGAAYVFVCAALISQRVEKIAIVAGTDPYSIPILIDQPELNSSVRALLYQIQKQPQEAIKALSLVTEPQTIYDSIISSSFEKDKEIFTKIKDILLNNLSEALQHNAINDGKEFLREYLLIFNDWQIALKDIKTPIDLWYGGQDFVQLHSVNNGEYLEGVLQVATRYYYPEEGCGLLWSLDKLIVEKLLE